MVLSESITAALEGLKVKEFSPENLQFLSQAGKIIHVSKEELNQKVLLTKDEVEGPRSSTFNTILNEMRVMHDKKSHDYSNEDPYSNFKKSAAFAGITVDQAFANLCGTKDARVTELLGKEAKNESMEDTLLDRAIYTVIWLAYRRDHLFNQGIRSQGGFTGSGGIGGR